MKDMGSFLKTWDAVLLDISMQTEKQTFATWLKGSRIIATDNGVWTVQLRDESAVAWVSNRLRPIIDRAMQRHAPGVEVEFVT